MILVLLQCVSSFLLFVAVFMWFSYLFLEFSIWFKEIVIKSCFGLYGHKEFVHFQIWTRLNATNDCQAKMRCSLFSSSFIYFSCQKNSVCTIRECSCIAIVQFPIKLHSIHSPNTGNSITQTTNYVKCELTDFISFLHFKTLSNLIPLADDQDLALWK